MQTVGEILREEREKRGLTVKDIETATSIRALYLSAIEEGNYSVVPGDVYVKGFIRNYAVFLGLDANQMVEIYRQSQLPPPEAEPVPETVPVDKPRYKESGKKKDFGRLTIGALLALLVAVIWWMLPAETEKPATPQKPPAPAAAPAAPPVTPPPPPATAPPAPGTPPVSAKPVQNKPIVVSVKYTDRCWTLVMVDGKQIFEGIPKQGESLTWEGDKEISVHLGNAGAADVIYNGKSAGKLGDVGDVTVKTFTATGIKP